MATEDSQSQGGNHAQEAIQEAKKTGRVPKRKLKGLIISLIIVVASSSTADILLKYSLSGNRAPKVHSAAGIPHAAVEALNNVWLDVAIVLIIIQFITFTHALRSGPLSLVVPVRGAATYVVTTLLASYFLHERVTPERWGAILIILVGVIMIGISGGGKKKQ